MNEYLLSIIIIGIYLIGIPIMYAITEDSNDKESFEESLMFAALWPIVLLYCIGITLGYSFYWITKQIINKLKH